MQKASPKKAIRKAQHQLRPGNEYKMQPLPVTENDLYCLQINWPAKLLSSPVVTAV